jgi:hypothetical protein
MAVTNVFQFVDWMTMEGLRLLTNSLEVTEHFETKYSKDFKQEFAIGGSERVPLAQQMLIRHGLGYTPQAIDRIYTTINFLPPFGVDFEWDDVQACLEMERGEERVKEEYIEPAMLQMRQEIDSQAALFAYQNSNNIVGVNGTDPTSLKMFNQARQIMIERAGWNEGERGCIIPPAINTSLVATAQGFLNPPKAISAQYQEGAIGRYAGTDWHESMSLFDHTAGTSTSPTVNSYTAGTVNGTGTLVVNCSSGDTFNVGDVYGIASVYPANPMTRRQTSGFQTQTVVVTTAVTSTGSTASLTVSPTLYGPGSQYQNVTALPLANAVLTLFPGTLSPNGTTGKQGLLINKGAFAIVSGRMVTPKAVEMASQNTDPDTGISLRFVRAWDPQQSKMTNRFDALIGFGALRPNNCSVRLLSAA